MPNFKEPKRFWSKVDVRGADECWEWQASKGSRDYGQFWLDQKIWIAHRVAWTLTFGPIPKGLLVCHHCDNRACCNPYHLFLGTYTDNLLDALRKGRRTRTLTEDDVLDIQELYTSGEWTRQELADEYGVSKNYIYKLTGRDK